MKKRIQINSSELVEMIDKIISELTTSQSTGAYDTPYAFATDETDEDEYSNDDIGDITESYQMYRQQMKDSSSSPSKVINSAIGQLNKKINEIDRYIKYNIKLKQENNISSDSYWKKSKKQLNDMRIKLAHITMNLKKL